jgi:type IV fimbrial biogenesis protein FimT
LRAVNDRSKGYSLVELLVTLLILVILSSLAVPAYRNFVTENQLTSQLNLLAGAIEYTRAEAIHRHIICTLCKSQDGKRCDGLWREGWIVFADRQSSGQVVSEDEILRVYAGMPSGGDLTWSGTRSNDYLQFMPTGSTRGQSGTFTYFPRVLHKNIWGKIIISQTGRVRIEKP